MGDRILTQGWGEGALVAILVFTFYTFFKVFLPKYYSENISEMSFPIL